MPVCYKPTQVSTVSSTSRQCWCHTLDLDNIIIITPHPPTSVQSAASVVLAKSGVGGGGGKEPRFQCTDSNRDVCVAVVICVILVVRQL